MRVGGAADVLQQRCVEHVRDRAVLASHGTGKSYRDKTAACRRPNRLSHTEIGHCGETEQQLSETGSGPFHTGQPGRPGPSATITSRSNVAADVRVMVKSPPGQQRT